MAENMTNETTSPCALFGGAVACFLPIPRMDISEVRQVPDNQEVYAHPKTDQSIVIELLEYQNIASGEEATRAHYLDISQANKSTETVVLSHEEIETNRIAIKKCTACHYLTGTQKIAKFNESEEDSNIVRVQLVLYRLQEFDTDLVVTFNDPVSVSAGSSSNKGGEGNNWDLEQFKDLVSSIRLLDESIFNA